MNINIENALKIGGWMSEPELVWLATQAQGKISILEVGSWMGRSTRALADNCVGEVFAIDTWNGTAADSHAKLLEGKGEDYLVNEFLKNKSKNTYGIRGESKIKLQGMIDEGLQFEMIFIDGDHSYEAVHSDITLCKQLLADGGLLCGHDFDAGREGVVKAVRELVPTAQMADAGSIWYKP